LATLRLVKTKPAFLGAGLSYTSSIISEEQQLSESPLEQDVQAHCNCHERFHIPDGRPAF
jgi:hypothetical protein